VLTARGGLKLALDVLAQGDLYWPGIRHHWETAKDPYFIPFDAVQYIPPFFKFDPEDPIPTTYVKEYYLNAVCPPLYKWLTIVGAQLGDVRHFQFGMMYFVYAVFLGVLGRLGWVLGGAALSFAVVAITMTAWICIGLGFIGGAPRMYAYPLISLVLYSLIFRFVEKNNECLRSGCSAHLYIGSSAQDYLHDKNKKRAARKFRHLPGSFG
jgi:hypothetical protein